MERDARTEEFTIGHVNRRSEVILINAINLDRGPLLILPMHDDANAFSNTDFERRRHSRGSSTVDGQLDQWPSNPVNEFGFPVSY
jgi:hypothetical protein